MLDAGRLAVGARGFVGPSPVVAVGSRAANVATAAAVFLLAAVLVRAGLVSADEHEVAARGTPRGFHERVVRTSTLVVVNDMIADLGSALGSVFAQGLCPPFQGSIPAFAGR